MQKQGAKLVIAVGCLLISMVAIYFSLSETTMIVSMVVYGVLVIAGDAIIKSRIT